jgi:hypothetical protein
MRSLILLLYLLHSLKTTDGYKALNTCSKMAITCSSLHMDTLPHVLPNVHPDRIGEQLLTEAKAEFDAHKLPKTKVQWTIYSKRLTAKIIATTGTTIDHTRPLNITETGAVKMPGYTVKNIVFQTRPKVYATANLYVPDGGGKFPAVITMHGHWVGGKLYKDFKAVGQTLALNGYVCLVIDAWGAGERTTIDGKFDYHGANLGTSIMNIGESLMGGQISDNIRGVDLLCSLPYVDTAKIAATGASGGGNQTMWLSAIDHRIKAAIPVVSVGTFESYVMGRNCVCEVLIDGLTFTEEWGVLGLLAPRALKIFNSGNDIAAFSANQMKRSYQNAQPLFKLYHAEDKLAYQVFDTPHGYFPAMREDMVKWFNVNLKGIDANTPVKGMDADTIPNEKLLVYPVGHRDVKVENIGDYCRRIGTGLNAKTMNSKAVNPAVKRAQLVNILRIQKQCMLSKATNYGRAGEWDRLSIETNDHKLIPVLIWAPHGHNSHYVVVTHPEGKTHIPAGLLKRLKDRGDGIVLLDLLGTGESSSPMADKMDIDLPHFHTLSRSELWLGKTIMGEWVKELNVVTDYLRKQYKADQITLIGTRETALASLFMTATIGRADNVILNDAPVSYVFDLQENINYFNMAVHIPGILNWGNVALSAALSNAKVKFIDPVSMSGQKIDGATLISVKTEFNTMAIKYHQASRVEFIN